MCKIGFPVAPYKPAHSVNILGRIALYRTLNKQGCGNPGSLSSVREMQGQA